MKRRLQVAWRRLNWMLLGGLLPAQDVLFSLGATSPWFMGLQTMNALALAALARKV